MKKLKTMYERVSGLFPMAVFMVVYLLSFSLLEKRRPVHYTEIHMWLDDVIPFEEVFIVPYFLWFAFVAAAVLYLYFFDRKNYERAATMLYVGMTVFIVISFLFPNIQYLRPRYIPDKNVFTSLVKWIYRTDTNTNVFPSIHVYNTLCCMAGMYKCRRAFAESIWVKYSVTLLGVSIILSTMFLKQHSAVDVIGAFIMFVPLYMLVYNYGLVIAKRRVRAFSSH